MFEFAMLQFAVPKAGSYAMKEKCSIVIMDNCGIHYSERVFKAIRRSEGIVMFLPYVNFVLLITKMNFSTYYFLLLYF